MSDSELTEDPPPIPPTALQEAMWWVCRRVGDASVYQISWRLSSPAPVDPGALEAAWRVVVNRHEAIRLSMTRGDDGLTTTIRDTVPATVQRIEVDDPGPTTVEPLLRAIAEESHRRPFDLDRPPLARLTMVRVADRHELILTAHHIAVDGLGMQLLFLDLAHAYESAVRGAEPSFAVASSWREFALEERTRRNTAERRSSIDYWRSALSGATATTVAADRDVYAGTGNAGTTLLYSFSDGAARGLAALARGSSATSFAVVLACLQILLVRGGGGHDVVVGTVAANRLDPRDQQLVGYLVNQCLIRTAVSDDDTISTVVGRAAEASWEMFEHQAAPFPEVFSALPESTRSALGDIAPIMLNYLGAIGTGLRLGDIELTQRPSPNVAARTDMGIGYWHTADGGLMAEVEYSTRRYDENTVKQVLDDLDVLLGYGATPHARVREMTVRTRTVRADTCRSPMAPDSGPPVTSDLPGPAGVMRNDVSEVWADLLGRPPSSPEEDFFEAGGHSLKAVEFLASLAEVTGVDLDLATWLVDPTPRAIRSQLGWDDTANPGAGRQGTVMTIRSGTGRHVHLFPGAGGSLQDYRELVESLPDDCRVTYSHEDGPVRGIPQTADRFRLDLDAAGLRPDVLVGWSMGGQTAFEVAAGYEDGTAPGVVLIDAPPPVGPALGIEPVWQRLADFAASVQLTLDVAGGPLIVADSAAPHCEDDVQNALLVLSGRLRAAGHEVSAATLTDRWTTYEQHCRTVTTYVSDRVLDAPGALLAADLTSQGVTAWADRFTHSPGTERLDTDHHSILRRPAVTAVAATITRVAAASAPGGSAGAR